MILWNHEDHGEALNEEYSVITDLQEHGGETYLKHGGCFSLYVLLHVFSCSCHVTCFLSLHVLSVFLSWSSDLSFIERSFHTCKRNERS